MGPDGRYHEFNLAPTGAWWSASFSCYRQREKAVALPSVRTEAGLAEGSWSAALSFDLRDLDILGGDLEQARLSVTAIFAEATEQGPEYLCYGHHSGGEPDFHDVKAFLPARLETYKV